MTKRDQMIECMSAMEEGMKRTAESRDIWQNDLIWWICKAVGLLTEMQVKKEQSWEDIGRGICQCTGCGHGIRQHMACVNKFCPNCGAPMKGRKPYEQ